MPTTTTTYSFNKPVVGADEDSWGGYLNGNWDSVDDLLDGTTPITGIDINSGTLDGVTIGGTTAGAGTFTTLTANTSITGTLATAAQPNVTSLGTLTSLTVSGDVSFGDNDKAIFGAGSDLQIYHDGSASYIIENGPGDLNIQSNGSNLNLLINGGENAFTAANNGAVTLYYDNAAKLATTSTGIDVTGTVTADGLTNSGTSQFDGSVSLGVAGVSNAFLNTPSSLYVNIDSDNNSTNRVFELQRNSTDGTGSKLLKADENGDISFYEDTGTTAKFFWDASAESLGIGTSSPDSALHLNNTSGSGFSISDSDSTSSFNTTEVNNSNGNLTFNTRSSSGGFLSTDYQIGKTASGVDYHRWFTGLSSERMRIDSSGNVGIGTSSPENFSGFTTQTINGSTGSVLAMQAGGVGNTARFVKSASLFSMEAISAIPLVFTTNNSERMRIDSSGSLLVGKTSTSINTAGSRLIGGGAGAQFTADGTEALALNRLTSDGDLIWLGKAGTKVGSIGTANSGDLYIGNDDTTLLFAGGSDAVLPRGTAGASRDGAIDLGLSSHRFKDLYLSGGVYLGGTGSANKLDDYEEGTWTPYFSSSGATFTYNTQYGAYVKVGNIVHAQFYLNATATGTTSNSAEVQGLPFTSANLSPYHQWGCSCWFSGSLVLQPLTGNNSTAFSLWKNGAVSTAIASDIAGSRYLVGHVTYRAS